VPTDAAAAPPDGELVQRAREGEREAFALLYRRHRADVYRFACAMTGSAAVADDVVQDVFLALMRDLERYDPNRAGLRTYLFAMARNVARYRTRSVWRFLSLDHADVPAGADDPVAALSASEETRHLRHCLGTLPGRYREVIVLCDLQELEYADAAAVIGVPVGTVRSRLHRGRQMLLERLRRRQNVPQAHAKRCLI
jgi:RNA polymerase sigma-70 factor (ECF subfamily)